MPYGFSGDAAKAYLRKVEEALDEAKVAHNKDPFSTATSNSVPLPELQYRANEKSPYPESEAYGGGSTSGVGNSSNIVVDCGEYGDSIYKIIQTDAAIGESIYNATTEINNLCDEYFSVPLTTQEILIISHGVKNSLYEFTDLTTNTNASMSGFISNILSIS